MGLNCFPGEGYYSSTSVRTQSGLLLRHTLDAEIGIDISAKQKLAEQCDC